MENSTFTCRIEEYSSWTGIFGQAKGRRFTDDEASLYVNKGIWNFKKHGPKSKKTDDVMEGRQGKERTRGSGGLKNHCGKKVWREVLQLWQDGKYGERLQVKGKIMDM